MAAQKRHQPKKHGESAKPTPHQKSKPWDIRLMQPAEAAYERFYDLAERAKAEGDMTSIHITNMAQIDEVVEKIIPKNPFDKAHALTDRLSGIFRYAKGRMRICWMGSSEKRQIYVMFISETMRKAGDKNDPYEVLGKLVYNGQFDDLADFLGIKRPGGGKPRRPVTQ